MRLGKPCPPVSPNRVERSRRLLPRWLVAAVAIAIAGKSAQGAQKWYDTSSSAGLTSGSATWDQGTTAVWSTTSGGTALTTWAAGDDALFNTFGTDTLTISGTVDVNSMTFQNDAVTIQGGTLNLGAGGISLTGGTVSILNTTTLALTAAQAWSVGSPLNLSVGATMTGTGNLTLSGAGTVTLSGNDKNYSGAIAINAGTLSISNFNGNVFLGSGNISGAGSFSIAQSTNAIFSTVASQTLSAPVSGNSSGGSILLKSGTGTLTLSGANGANFGTAINGGTLVLDYSTPTGSAGRLSDGNSFRLGGGTVTLSGGSNYLEVAGSAILQSGGATTINRTATSKLQLGGFTVNVGSTVNFAEASLATTNTSNSSAGILGGYATVNGSDWAVSAASASNTNITALSAYTNLATTTSTTADTNNSTLTGSATITAGSGTDRTTNSLKLNTSGSTQSLDIGAGQSLTLSSGGLLFVGGQDYQINNGTLKANQATNSDLIFQQWGAGNLTVNSVIANGQGASTLTKSGTGTLTLGATNTYTGATYLNQGTLSISSNANLGSVSGTPTASALNINGATLQVTGNVNLFNGSAGSSTNNRPVALGGGGGTFDVTSTNTLAIAGAVTDYAASGTAVAPSVGSLTKIGTGTLTLSGVNTYTGATTVGTATGGGSGSGQITSATANGGTLTASGVNTLQGTASIAVNNGGTLLLAGAGTIDRVNNSAPIALGTTGAVAGSVGGTVSMAGLSTASETLGALTLSSNSTIDFGNGDSNSMKFGGLTLGGFSLSVRGWTGSVYSASETADHGGTQDHLEFTNNQTLTSAELSQISFYNDANVFIGTGKQISFDGATQIVPIPEPSTWFGAAGLLGLGAYRERRRFRCA